MPDPAVLGAVLAGGRSSRMGTDKALIQAGPEGQPLVMVAVAALRSAGAEPVVVGGDHTALEALGLTVVDEPLPGAGPLSGIAGALARAGERETVILPCDLPAVSGAVVRRLLAARRAEGADVAVPVIDGVRQAVVGAWAPAAAAPVSAALEAGARAVQAVLDSLRVAEVRDLSAGALVDLDVPEDLGRYAHDP